MPELLELLRAVEDPEIHRLLDCSLSPEELTSVDTYYRAKWTTASREEHKKSGGYFAGPGTSYPLKDCSDAHDAWNLAGHADNPDQVRKNVKRWSSEHSCTLPSTAKDDGDDDRAAASDLIIPEQAPEEVPTTPEQENETEERAEMPDQAFLHLDIIRIDKNKREVTGVATSEAVDTFGTVFAYDASKQAFKNWIDRAANVREMHDKKAVGKGIGVRFDDEQKKIFVTTRVSRSADGDNAWTKIEEGILNGFSVGASGRTAVWDTVERNGKKYPYLIKYDLSELSLVDNASNPDAQGLLIARADALVEEVVDVTESEVTEQQTPTSTQVPVSSPFSSDVPGSASDLERAGARVSKESTGALHGARNTAMKSSMGIMKHCKCQQCQDIHNALDPDDDGDIDFMGMDDPDGDADSLMAERTQEPDFTQFEAKVEETIERVFSSKITSFLQRQQSVLTRFASIDTPEFELNPDLIRSVVSAEISSLVTPLEERLTTALERLDTSSSLSEVRSVLTEVKETVERIASQPAAGGPVLNGGHPIDKRFANQPYANAAQSQIDPRTFWDMAQKQGLLTSPESQMKAAAAMAIPMAPQR